MTKPMDFWHKCFPVSFAEFLRTSVYRTPPVIASEHYVNEKWLAKKKHLDGINLDSFNDLKKV